MARSAEQASTREEWKQLVSGGGLFAVVLAILVFGAVRETPRKAEAPSDIPRGVPIPHEATLTRIPQPVEAAPLVVPEAKLDPLLQRTSDDPRRLAQSAQAWTLQLAVACRKETASRLLERAGSSERFYVLPATVKDQDCFRLCWGTYASREDAARAHDLPPELASGSGTPQPRKISEMMQ